MIEPERVAAIRAFGYTPREAEFVATAALHGGYFLRRQICAKYGPFADRLCRKVVAQGHATVKVYPRNTHLYHLQYKPLYSALGDEDNRNRRPVPQDRIRVKLMALDYALAHPAARFLPTEEDKVEYFTVERGLPEGVLPSNVYFSQDRRAMTRRYFVDKFPLRVDAGGNVAFVYVDDGLCTPVGFTFWMGQYAPLIRALESVEVVYASPENAKRSDKAARAFGKTFGGVAEYEILRGEFERTGGAGWPQAKLDEYRILSKRVVAKPNVKLTRWVLCDGYAAIAGGPAASGAVGEDRGAPLAVARAGGV
ncbi:MAG: hypothetical protein NVS1B14_01710 [Vulcanimicrobiaceae bacterium]